MRILIKTRKFGKSTAIVALLALAGTACTPAVILPTQTPAFQTVEVTRQVTQQGTQEVTQEVTREVSLEVTRVVEVQVPVTVTPSLTPEISLTPSRTSTITRTPSITPTPEPPVVTMLKHVACYYGPGDVYLYDYGLNETSWMEVIGRNPDGTFLFVQGVHGWNPCWVRAEFVRFNDGGDVTTHNIRIVSSQAMMPYAMNLYRPPAGIQTIRKGDKVTIYWSAVWMTEDDYRGYLIEGWLCQGGQLLFKPIGFVPPLSKNVGTLGIIVTDEPGCLVPSSARIYTAEKHGYTGYKVIPWPPYEPSPTPTP